MSSGFLENFWLLVPISRWEMPVFPPMDAHGLYDSIEPEIVSKICNTPTVSASCWICRKFWWAHMTLFGRVRDFSVRPIRSGRFNLANSIWPFRSEPFRSELFRSELFQSDRFGMAVSATGLFGHGTFRSRDISVRLWNLAEILHVHFLMQTCFHQRKVLFKKTTSMMQDPADNQHKHMIFIIINKQIKSLLTFCN